MNELDLRLRDVVLRGVDRVLEVGQAEFVLFLDCLCGKLQRNRLEMECTERKHC